MLSFSVSMVRVVTRTRNMKINSWREENTKKTNVTSTKETKREMESENETRKKATNERKKTYK